MRKNTKARNNLSPYKVKQQKKILEKDLEYQKFKPLELMKHKRQINNKDNNSEKKLSKKLKIDKKQGKITKKKRSLSKQDSLTQYGCKKAQKIIKDTKLKKTLTQKQFISLSISKQTKNKQLSQQSQKSLYFLQKPKKSQNIYKRINNQTYDDDKNITGNLNKTQTLDGVSKNFHFPLKQRFKTFEIRSQKYSRIIQQLKQTKPAVKQIEKPQSAYKSKIQKLHKQIENYRKLTTKSERALRKMQELKQQQQDQYRKQKQAYIHEILKIKQQLMQYKPNLGHIYSYPQFRTENLVPEVIIPEDSAQNRVIQNKLRPNNYDELIIKGQKIMAQFTQKNSQLLDQNSVKEVYLSVTSKYSQD